MRDADNIRQIDELGCVDWMGFIFFPPSSRNVERVPDYLPKHCKRVGVFVNEFLPTILKYARTYHLDLIQLHGDESPLYCHTLRTHSPAGTRIIKTIPITTPDDLAATYAYENNAYKGKVHYFLFETKCKEYGGSGKQFDWEILQHYKGQTPFLLTGGIGFDDAEKVKAFHHPQFAGIDLNSRFETAPALKDVQLIKEFIKQIK